MLLFVSLRHSVGRGAKMSRTASDRKKQTLTEMKERYENSCRSSEGCTSERSTQQLTETLYKYTTPTEIWQDSAFNRTRHTMTPIEFEIKIA